jgi:hypothetical protein
LGDALAEDRTGRARDSFHTPFYRPHSSPAPTIRAVGAKQ